MDDESEGYSTDLVALEKRLADPATVATLNHLLDNADLMAGLLDMLTGFLGNSEHVLDNVRDSAREVTDMAMSSPQVRKVVEFGPTMADFGEQLIPLITKVTDEDFVTRFSESGLLDPGMINLTIQIASGINYANEKAAESKDIKPPGLIKLAMMLKDLQVRRGLAFALEILKELGRSLADEAREDSGMKGTSK